MRSRGFFVPDSHRVLFASCSVAGRSTTLPVRQTCQAAGSMGQQRRPISFPLACPPCRQALMSSTASLGEVNGAGETKGTCWKNGLAADADLEQTMKRKELLEGAYGAAIDKRLAAVKEVFTALTSSVMSGSQGS